MSQSELRPRFRWLNETVVKIFCPCGNYVLSTHTDEAIECGCCGRRYQMNQASEIIDYRGNERRRVTMDRQIDKAASTLVTVAFFITGVSCVAIVAGLAVALWRAILGL